METYLKPGEVAVALRVTPRAVYGWLQSGKLEAYRPFGRWLITPEQLDRFVKGGRSASPSSVAESVTEQQPLSGAAPSLGNASALPSAGQQSRPGVGAGVAPGGSGPDRGSLPVAGSPGAVSSGAPGASGSQGNGTGNQALANRKNKPNRR
jgi:excisionase family DNA binding protein